MMYEEEKEDMSRDEKEMLGSRWVAASSIESTNKLQWQ
jgi:hypothetical protein